jgi:aspartate ammonia-lyase
MERAAVTDLRTETDSLGPKQLPREAVWGVHTARALENFPITGVPLAQIPELVRALAMVKKAAALANRDLGALDAGLAAAIGSACDEIIAGRHHEHFVVDMIQGGAGTSTNMNANEVIANLALTALGHARGDYARLHPNDHVNRSQFTNDVYPTPIRWRFSKRGRHSAPSSSGSRRPSPSAPAPSQPSSRSAAPSSRTRCR